MAPLTGIAAANAIGGYMALGARDARFDARRVELALRMGSRIKMILRPLRLPMRVMSSPRASVRPRVSRRMRTTRARQPDPHLPEGA